MASSAASRSITAIRCWGWMGSASIDSSAAIFSRHSAIPSGRRSRKERSVLRSSRGSRAAKRLLGVADHAGRRWRCGCRPGSGSASICTTLAWPGLGQVLGVREVGADHEQRVALLHGVLGRAPCRAGRCRRWSSGWSSGTTALPGRVLTIGLPSSFGRRPAPRPGRAGRPAPTSMTTLLPAFEHLGGGLRGRGAGAAPGGGRKIGAVGLMTAGAGGLPGVGVGVGDLDVGRDREVRRPSRRARAWRTARSTRVGTWAGTWIISLYSATSMNSFSSATSCW